MSSRAPAPLPSPSTEQKEQNPRSCPCRGSEHIPAAQRGNPVISLRQLCLLLQHQEGCWQETSQAALWQMHLSSADFPVLFRQNESGCSQCCCCSKAGQSLGFVDPENTRNERRFLKLNASCIKGQRKNLSTERES